MKDKPDSSPKSSSKNARKKKRRKRLKVYLIILFLLLVIVSIPAIRTLHSLEIIADYPIYRMRYYGNYAALTKLWNWGFAQSPFAENDQTACSLIAAFGDRQNLICGRNLDWQHSPMLVLLTHPPGRYTSVSLVDLAYLGFDDSDSANQLTWGKKLKLLSSPMLPFEGINEKGLVVTMASVSDQKTPFDANAKTISSLYAIRLLLDNASTTDEAIALLRDYNIRFKPGPHLQYMIADARGMAVVVELIDGKYKLHPNLQDWLIATNFYLSEVSDTQPIKCDRYLKAREILTRQKGILNNAEMLALLQTISLNNTQWSVVYHLNELTLDVAVGKNYEVVHVFDLEHGD